MWLLWGLNEIKKKKAWKALNIGPVRFKGFINPYWWSWTHSSPQTHAKCPSRPHSQCTHPRGLAGHVWAGSTRCSAHAVLLVSCLCVFGPQRWPSTMTTCFHECSWGIESMVKRSLPLSVGSIKMVRCNLFRALWQLRSFEHGCWLWILDETCPWGPWTPV